MLHGRNHAGDVLLEIAARHAGEPLFELIHIGEPLLHEGSHFRYGLSCPHLNPGNSLVDHGRLPFLERDAVEAALPLTRRHGVLNATEVAVLSGRCRLGRAGLHRLDPGLDAVTSRAEIPGPLLGYRCWVFHNCTLKSRLNREKNGGADCTPTNRTPSTP